MLPGKFQLETIHATNKAQVESPLNKGVVRLHMIKHPGSSDFEYKYLFLDVKGHERIYLEKADESSKGKGKTKLSFFGVKW